MSALPGFADLMYLADHAGDLIEARFRGTPRPWKQAGDLDAAQRAEQLERDAAERRDRNPLSIGEHPAPMHVDVSDVLVDLLMTADDIAEQVAQAAGVDRLPYASSAFADPEPYLRHAARHLAMAYEADPSLQGGVKEDAERLRKLVATHLGEVLAGQRVPGLCPWCNGGLEQRQTLRIRFVRPAPTLDPVPAAVCESGVCEPPDSDVGVWAGNCPAWPLDTEGAWLSQRIAHHAAQGPCCYAPKPTTTDDDARCGEPIFPKGGQVPRYCSSACRRAEYAQRKRDQREAS